MPAPVLLRGDYDAAALRRLGEGRQSGFGAQMADPGRSVGKGDECRLVSGEAGRDRLAETRHSIDHCTGHPGFSLLSRQTPSAQTPADQSLVAKHRSLDQKSAFLVG